MQPAKEPWALAPAISVIIKYTSSKCPILVGLEFGHMSRIRFSVHKVSHASQLVEPHVHIYIHIMYIDLAWFVFLLPRK